MAVEVAEVLLWGRTIGAVAWDERRGIAAFEYDTAFQRSGIEVAPLTMPLGPVVYSFPTLSKETYLGLPGLLADTLPDRFGNALIDNWLVTQGRSPADFSPLERLCYIGSRGMGALEFRPALGRPASSNDPLDVGQLVELANLALQQKTGLQHMNEPDQPEVSRPVLSAVDLTKIIQVGTSAGGARAKAVIGWNESSGEVRSGQLDLPEGFEHWLLKFDGVTGNGDRLGQGELADPAGYGRIEYAYSLMAEAAGVWMAPTRLLEEGGRAHFMTKRFDRLAGRRLHMQTLSAMAHYDFNQAGAHSYEQAVSVIRQLGMHHPEQSQQVRRAVFNVVTRNQDDHTKNIAFLMDRQGVWSLSPAYDVSYAFNPTGAWTSQHQMTLNGKRDKFDLTDVVQFATTAAGLSHREAKAIVNEVNDAAGSWSQFATEAGIESSTATQLGATFRRLT